MAVSFCSQHISNVHEKGIQVGHRSSGRYRQVATTGECRRVVADECVPTVANCLTSSRRAALSRRNFFIALEDMRLGLSGTEMQRIVQELAGAGHGHGKKISIDGFMEHFGGGEAARQSDHRKAQLARLGKEEKFLMQPPDIAVDMKAEYEKAVGKELVKPEPLLVFCLGFFICPVWCLGWVWVNSKEVTARRQGRRSVALSFVGCIVGLILAAVLLVQPEGQMNARHCAPSQGLLVSLKFRGRSANMVEFGSYGTQYNFKLATHGLWFSKAKDKSLMAEEAVLIDDIYPLQYDPDGADIGMVLRLLTSDTDETALYSQEVRAWIADGSWKFELSNFNVFLENIWFSPIEPSLARHAILTTPRPFKLAPFPYVVAELNLEDPIQVCACACAFVCACALQHEVLIPLRTF